MPITYIGTVPHISEPLIQDLLWTDLKQRPEIVDAASEVDVGCGRIDLVAKNTNGEFIGFEVKDYKKTNQFQPVDIVDNDIDQATQYANSGYLDKVYLCCWDVSIYQKALSKPVLYHRPHGGSIGSDIYKPLSRGVEEGLHTKDEIAERLRRGLPNEIHDRTHGVEYIIDKVRPEGPETYDPKHIGDVIEEIKSDWITYPPDELGLVEIPLDIDIIDQFNQHLNTSLDDLYPDPKIPVNTVEEAKKLERTQMPHLSKSNEAWISHHIVEQKGTIREGVIPSPGTPRRIDVIQFKGSYDPSEVKKTQGESQVVGYEAKTGFGNKEEIRSQLLDYLNTGALTNLYLAVPRPLVEKAKQFLEKYGKMDTKYEYTLEKVGLISVDQSGDIETHLLSESVEMVYDSYSTKHNTRPIGYGKLRPTEVQLSGGSTCDITQL